MRLDCFTLLTPLTLIPCSLFHSSNKIRAHPVRAPVRRNMMAVPLVDLNPQEQHVHSMNITVIEGSPKVTTYLREVEYR